MMEEQSLPISEIPGIMIRAKEIPLFGETEISPEDIGLINKIAPVSLSARQVYARSMYLCSSQPCPADGCQFTRKALEQIAGLIIGQSVLTGHNRASLPIARFYKATVEQRGINEAMEPVYFVRAWFYWLRDTKGADDLLLNIDGGIYREVSLSWRYSSWQCSICQSKNSECGHRTGELIDGKRCYRLIDQVSEVLEGSLVYKAADTNTTLAGVRGIMDFEDEPVLIISKSGDPLFSKLLADGLLVDVQEIPHGMEPLHDSVRMLWIRGSQEESLSLADFLLTPDGACMVDEPDAPVSGTLILKKNPLVVQRGDDSRMKQTFKAEEAEHATIRPL